MSHYNISLPKALKDLGGGSITQQRVFWSLNALTRWSLVFVVAIGAGSLVVSHANDSYFWVVTQFSGMSVSQGYRLQSLGTLVEGCTAALAVWLVSLVVL